MGWGAPSKKSGFWIEYKGPKKIQNKNPTHPEIPTNYLFIKPQSYEV